jgi:hypothetical protein
MPSVFGQLAAVKLAITGKSITAAAPAAMLFQRRAASTEYRFKVLL